jgi:dipeptide transport system substrate-binding protein
MNKCLLFFWMCLCVLSANATDKTLVYCAESGPEYLTPSFDRLGVSFDVTSHLYSRLVGFDLESLQLEPGLAQSWKISQDGLTYTFYLRQDVKWHSNEIFKPTRNFTADDVLFTFNRQWKPHHPYHEVGVGQYPYFEGLGLRNIIADIVKVDDYTVRFELKKPHGPFLSELSMYWAAIQSQEYAEFLMKIGQTEWFEDRPIGTGAFSFVAYTPSKEIVLQAFDDYWQGRPKLDFLRFDITPDSHERWRKVLAGDCHVMSNPSPSDLNIMRYTPSVHVMDQMGLNVGYMAFNTRLKPVNDARVRKAIIMSIDKIGLLRATYQSTALPAANPIPPILWSYNNQLADDRYDVLKARALLKEAGFENGLKLKLLVPPVSRTYMLSPSDVGQYIKLSLENLNIEVEIESVEWSKYTQYAQQGHDELVLYGWNGDMADPDNFLHELLSCDTVGLSNLSNFCDPAYENLIQSARTISYQATRAQLYRRAQVRFKELAPLMPISHSVLYKVVRRNVKGLVVSPTGRNYFYKVDLQDL